MKIETDKAEFLSGVRHERSMGAPILMAVWNRDCRIETAPELTCPRPGHADLAGFLKFGAPIRDVLERASARETAARVAAGALCRQFLEHFNIAIRSHVVSIGSVAVPDGFGPTFEDMAHADESEVRCLHKPTEAAMISAIDDAKKNGDTLGGVFEIVVQGLPIGLGDHTQWDRKLDGRIAQVIMSIQAIKGVEIGLGFKAATLPGSRVHDPINYQPSLGTATYVDTVSGETVRDPINAMHSPNHAPDGGFHRPTNGAGGLEGGITNGAPLVVRAAMKPISTLMKPLMSVDLDTGEPKKADIERSDYCAVPAAAVVGENFLAFVLAQAFCEKFGGDSLVEIQRNYTGYIASIGVKRG